MAFCWYTHVKQMSTPASFAICQSDRFDTISGRTHKTTRTEGRSKALRLAQSYVVHNNHMSLLPGFDLLNAK